MKTNVAVFYGCRSVEHEVSIISAVQAMHSIDREKYDVTPVYVTKSGEMYTGEKLFNIEEYKNLPELLKQCKKVNFVKENDNSSELMKHLAAGGFKDITRIASSSPTMWQHICLKNDENIVRILDQYIEMLEDAKKKVRSNDEQEIYNLFEASKNYRNSIPGGSSGPIKRAFAVYCDIIDEAGGIAAIATILAANNINLKNIGIVHNREFEEGVLRIEFYDEDSSHRAAEVLQKYRYIVYER